LPRSPPPSVCPACRFVACWKMRSPDTYRHCQKITDGLVAPGPAFLGAWLPPLVYAGLCSLQLSRLTSLALFELAHGLSQGNLTGMWPPTTSVVACKRVHAGAIQQGVPEPFFVTFKACSTWIT
jgi:hypothetical protein